MERRVIRDTDGQELDNEDLVIMADDAALADDRVLWELLRLQPGSATPQKAILPYGVSGEAIPAGLHSTALVQGNAADGKVRVMPFRAIVGSTTLFADSPIENLRGIRSGYCVGSTALPTEVAIAANASGNPRWTLVYAIVTPDAAGDTLTIKVKDPTTSTITSVPSTVLNKVVTVTLATVDGATGASPTRPSLPADGAGSYRIALAYIFVPTGFGGSSTVQHYQIHEDAPVVTLAQALGAPVLRPANQSHKIGGVVDLAQNPSRNAANRTGAFLPSGMVGGAERVILLQLGLSPVSHVDGDVVDDSIDWRLRFFTWTCFVGAGSATTDAFVSDKNGTGAAHTTTRVPCARAGQLGVNTMVGTGQSFFDDSYGLSAFYGTPFFVIGNGGTADATGGSLTELGGGLVGLGLVVDATTGALKLQIVGAINTCQVFIWLRASAPHGNAASL